MALDFSAVRSKLAKAQTKGEKKDFTKIYFKPTVGKQRVRIVPWKEDKTNPFIEVELHKYDTFKKFIPTLNNFGEQDPILKFRKKVYDDVTSTKEDKDFMKHFAPRTAVFVQVIVRGQEELGVRLWELNKTNFEAVASIAVEEDEYGDITDIVNGRDLLLEGYSEVNPQTGKTYTAVNIKPSVKQTPLSTDAAQAKDWTTNQLSPIEQYTRLGAEDLKKLLDNFLNPSDEPEEEEEEEEVPAPKPAPKAPAKAPTKKAFAKLDEEPEEAPEVGEEEETPAPKAKAVATKAPAVKPKAKPVVEEVPEDLPWEGEDVKDPEEEEAPAPKAKAKPAAKPAPKALSIAKKFDDLYGDDDDE